jgi:hypothetical protein
MLKIWIRTNDTSQDHAARLLYEYFLEVVLSPSEAADVTLLDKRDWLEQLDFGIDAWYAGTDSDRQRALDRMTRDIARFEIAVDELILCKKASLNYLASS